MVVREEAGESCSTRRWSLTRGLAVDEVVGDHPSTAGSKMGKRTKIGDKSKRCAAVVQARQAPAAQAGGSQFSEARKRRAIERRQEMSDAGDAQEKGRKGKKEEEGRERKGGGGERKRVARRGRQRALRTRD